MRLRVVVFVRAGAERVEVPSAKRAADDRVCAVARTCAYACAAVLRQWPAEHDARRSLSTYRLQGQREGNTKPFVNCLIAFVWVRVRVRVCAHAYVRVCVYGVSMGPGPSNQLSLRPFADLNDVTG